MNIKKLTPLFVATLFSVALIGCSSTDSGNSVTGNVTTPKLQISPVASFEFTTVTLGNTTAPFEITISNTGNARLDVSSIALSDTNNFKLEVGTTAPQCTFAPALDAGESCEVEVRFEPQQAGTFTASLEIKSNDPSTPELVSLTGTGEAIDSVMNVTINQVDPAGTCPNGEVTAYVSVTDQNNFPITGLTLSDFTLEEDATPVGALSGTSFVGQVNEPISIVIAMDYSVSIEDDIPEMQESAIKIIENLSPNDEAEIIKFNDLPEIVQSFTNDKDALKAAINADTVIGGTALYDAIVLAVNGTPPGLDGLKDRAIKRKAIIVISDGGNSDNLSNTTIDDPINEANSNDIPVFVVALGSSTDKFLPNLMKIADDTSGQLYEAALVQNLDTILQQQLSKVLFVDQYILKYDTGSTTSSPVNLTVTATKTAGMLSGTSSRSAILCP